MSLASAAQKRKIFLLAERNGMDSDLLHAYIQALAGRDSVRKLTVREAVQVIDGLSGKAVRSSRPQSDAMSMAQKRYLASLAVQMGWVDSAGRLDEGRLDGFCRKQQDVLYWTALSRAKACRVIEALKAMAERGAEIP
jgi:hypothetical protein